MWKKAKNLKSSGQGLMQEYLPPFVTLGQFTISNESQQQVLFEGVGLEDVKCHLWEEEWVEFYHFC